MARHGSGLTIYMYTYKMLGRVLPYDLLKHIFEFIPQNYLCLYRVNKNFRGVLERAKFAPVTSLLNLCLFPEYMSEKKYELWVIPSLCSLLSPREVITKLEKYHMFERPRGYDSYNSGKTPYMTMDQSSSLIQNSFGSIHTLQCDLDQVANILCQKIVDRVTMRGLRSQCEFIKDCIDLMIYLAKNTIRPLNFTITKHPLCALAMYYFDGLVQYDALTHTGYHIPRVVYDVGCRDSVTNKKNLCGVNILDFIRARLFPELHYVFNYTTKNFLSGRPPAKVLNFILDKLKDKLETARPSLQERNYFNSVRSLIDEKWRQIILDCDVEQVYKTDSVWVIHQECLINSKFRKDIQACDAHCRGLRRGVTWGS